jgi:hypothetical protein|nr:MAG TPA: hypothetical protein [Bacteriophage sp.]
MKIESKIKKFQQGGTMPQEAPAQGGEMPAGGQAPEGGAPEQGGQDPMVQILQVAA